MIGKNYLGYFEETADKEILFFPPVVINLKGKEAEIETVRLTNCIVHFDNVKKLQVNKCKSRTCSCGYNVQ